MRDNAELQTFHRALSLRRAEIIHIDEAVSARASHLLEQHTLGNGLQLADALIGATALEHTLPLLTGNAKLYRAINGLEVEIFRPGP